VEVADVASQNSTIVRAGRRVAGVIEIAAPALGAVAVERAWFRVPGVDAARRGVSLAEAAADTRAGAALPLGDPAGIPWRLLVGGREVVGRTWGDGPAVYLVHGWGGWGTQLVAFVRPLVEAGLRVVTFDSLGHGDSASGPLGRGRSSLVELAEVLAAVVDEHGPATAVVAHSLGGAATAIALRDGLKAGRVVLVAPAADPGPYLRAAVYGAGFGRRVLARARARIERRVGVRLDDLNVPRMASVVATPPVLVVHDRDDREVAWSGGAAIAESWPDSMLVSTTGLGHRRILRDPVVVAEVTAFVAAAVAVR
jgi:pimeloyl-ACP methyl ester carboxylesterase